MSEVIKGIMTVDGVKKIDYNSLANLPKVATAAQGEKADQAMSLLNGTATGAILQWVGADGSTVKFREMGSLSNGLHYGFYVLSSDGKQEYFYPLISTTEDGHIVGFATAAQGKKADNAIPNSGGVIPGAELYFNNKKGGISAWTDVTQIKHFTDDNNYTYLAVGDNEDVKNAVKLSVYENGTWKATYDIYGSHNKPTPSAIGAATAAQGEKADNAMPKSGGTFNGDITVATSYRPAVKLSADGSERAWIFVDDNVDYRMVFRSFPSDYDSAKGNSISYLLPKPETGLSGMKNIDIMTATGGTFSGNVKAYETERTDRGLFNEETRTANTNHTGTLQKVKYFLNEI